MGTDLPESIRCWGQSCGGELGAIGEVEGFGAVDEFKTFVYREGLRNVHIPVVGGIDAQVVELSGKGAEIVCQLLGRDEIELGDVKGMANIAGVVIEVTAVVNDVPPSEWSTGLVGLDEGHGPTAKDAVGKPVGIAEEATSFAKGKFVRYAAREAVGTV